jgi:hypothetical protein
VEERAVHSTAPIKKQVVQTGELNNMICSLIGIKRNIEKADRGHYRYYGVTYNSKMMGNFLDETEKLLFKWLNRRSRRSSYTWEAFKKDF